MALTIVLGSGFYTVSMTEQVIITQFGMPVGEPVVDAGLHWKTPFILSPHNSRIHYSAGNYVFRSLNKGTAVASISPGWMSSEKSVIANSFLREG